MVNPKEKAVSAAEAAFGKKGEDILILDVGRVTFLTDYFVICSGESQRQVQALMEEVDKTLSRKGYTPQGVEGSENLLWVLMDYDDIIVHIFKKEIREFYNLERLWGDAPRVTCAF